MSSIKDKLLEGMKEAMKEGDNDKVAAIRKIRAAIKNGEIEKRKDFSNAEVSEVLLGVLKSRQEARDEYIRLGCETESKNMEREIAVLCDYLPFHMESEKIESLITEIINETGADKEEDLCRVISEAMLRINGCVDENQVKSIALMKLK